jgi:uncharacterized protein YegP (UPF0339 family)
MAGTFEVFMDRESNFRFRLTTSDGTVVAESAAFADKPAAVAGIAAVRECAGMGLVTDLCPNGRMQAAPQPPEGAARQNPTPPARHGWHKRADPFHARAGTIRKAATAHNVSGAA